MKAKYDWMKGKWEEEKMIVVGGVGCAEAYSVPVRKETEQKLNVTEEQMRERSSSRLCTIE